MEKNQKKDLEQLLIKQTEKVFREIDPSVTVIFSKNIKSHCKDLAKKFLKSQKKFQKQIEAIAAVEKIELPNNKAISENNRAEVTASPAKKQQPLKTVKKTSSSAAAKTKKAVVKKIRKGNNLMNALSHQNKSKAKLSKHIDKISK
jgi:hypothetical protein